MTGARSFLQVSAVVCALGTVLFLVVRNSSVESARRREGSNVDPGVSGGHKSIESAREPGAPSRITGLVRLPDGRAAIDAEVYSGGLHTSTDQLGHFVLDCAPAEREIEAHLEIDGRTYHGADILSASESSSVISLWEVARHRTVNVRILLPNGLLVPRCRLRYGSEGASRRTINIYEGTAQLEIDRRTLWLEAFQPKDAAGNMLSAGPARVWGRIRDNWVVRLAEGASVALNVVDRGGRPVPHVSVTARPIRSVWTRGKRIQDNHVPIHSGGRTDASGFVLLRGLGQGRYSLSFVPRCPFLPKEKAIDVGTAETQVDIVLSQQITAEVRITHEGPMPGCRSRVFRVADGLKVAEALSDKHGVCTLSGLVAGEEYVLRVDPPEPASMLAPAFVCLWEPAMTRLKLGPGRTIKGRVARATGDTIISGVVMLYTVASRRMLLKSAQLERDGTFTLHGLPKEPILLEAELFDGFPCRATVQVLSQERTVFGTVPSGPTLVVQIEGATEGMDAWVRAPDGRTLRRSVAGGAIRVANTVRGTRYMIRVGPTDDGRVFVGSIIGGESPVSARLERGRLVTGTVTVPDGLPLPDVAFYRFDMYLGSAGIRPDGRFWAFGMPPGTLRIQATVAVFDERWDGEITTDQSRGIELQLNRAR